MKPFIRYVFEQERLIDNPPKAFIVPHASEEYSGHIAIEVLKKIPDYDYRSIILLGIDHEDKGDGIYVGSDYTPDKDRIHLANQMGLDKVEGDHSIGHIIPLIERFVDIPIFPVVVKHTPEYVSLLRSMVDNDTLVIASTDLSHYHNHIEAGKLDRRSIKNILKRGIS